MSRIHEEMISEDEKMILCPIIFRCSFVACIPDMQKRNILVNGWINNNCTYLDNQVITV